MEKLKIPYPIVVEGKYDKIKILSVCEAYVIATDGFGVFNNSELVSVIRKLAQKSKIILLTDSDGAGKVIRSHLTSCLPKESLIQLYIPQIKGKEKRKQTPSAEGFVGVEGIDCRYIYDLLFPFADPSRSVYAGSNITKADLYRDGLTGKDNSAAKRDFICKNLGLPVNMTANAFMEALRVICTYEEYEKIISHADSYF